jgi:tetratricopeptide (TPR) repeat protein
MDKTRLTRLSDESAPSAGLEGSAPADLEATIQTSIHERTASSSGAPHSADPEAGSPPPVPPGASPARRSQNLPLRWITLLGVLLLALVAATSAVGGYGSGISQRKSAEATQVAVRIQEQFELGVQDIDSGRYGLARQRFEYVIQLDPSYPGVTEKLAEVLLKLNATSTPTPAPTPTLTPTPDLRNVEEISAQAQQQILNAEWNLAVETLLNLRKADQTYRPVWVDDMLYVAYRNRGKDKILKDGDLEGGIYDLTQAEQIGPLDADAKSYLTWARLYITGASFWELDWAQAVYYFAQVAPALPNLRDGSGWTATERYRLALAGYGDFLAENGDWCSAVEQFDLSLTMGTDAAVEEARDFADEKCSDKDRKDEGGSGGEPEPASQETQPAPATEVPPADTPPPATTPYP